METISKYSFYNFLYEYEKNKERIHDYLNGRETIVEPFEDDGLTINIPDGLTKDEKEFLGLSIGVFIVIFVVMIAIYIAAIYLLIKRWNNLEQWAQIVGSISLIFGMPFITIIVVLVGKKKTKRF
jgi:hypothetical protein